MDASYYRNNKYSHMRKIYIILLLFCMGCAQQGALTGGEKDTIPPQLISNNDTLRTNFNEKEFLLEFNENIQFISGKTSLFINPYIEDYKITTEKTSLLIKWEDTLKSNTTYSFIFIKSIADLTEKNTITEFKHTFSTGNKTDSGTIKGEVTLMPEKIPAEDFLVQIKSVDSSDYVYHTLTDKKGHFKMENIKNGNYILTTFKDENKNFLLDTLRESQGYYFDTINITDSISSFQISSFKPGNKTNIEKTLLNDVGLLKIDFNQLVDSCIIYDTINKNSYYSLKKSESHVFYLKDTLDKYIFIVSSTLNHFYDTIRVSNKFPSNSTKKISYKKEDKTHLMYNKSLSLLFNQQILSIDSSKIELVKDSSAVNFSITHKENVILITPFSESGNFNATFYPKSFKGVRHEKVDTSIVNFNILSNEELSNLNLSLKNIEHPYSILQIINNDEIKNEFTFEGRVFDTSFANCIPGNYKLKLIADTDKNNYWSKGNVISKTQPEKIYDYKDEIKLQKNWTADITWDFSPKE